MSLPSPDLDRYREIIPDHPAFLETLGRPLPAHARRNTLRPGSDELAERLARYGASCRPVRGLPEAVRIEGLPNPGATLEYFLGWYHMQALASMFPPRVLAPKPGQRVLDLCASPGSKATQIAAMMENRGILVANEPMVGRLNLLKFHLERLGVTNTVVTRYQGQVFPEHEPVAPGSEASPRVPLRFDGILVDAPCSGEGTWRNPAVCAPAAGRRMRRPFDPRARGHLARQQKAMLRKAYRLLPPGGRVVYSTCTYAPEENEAVVQTLLDESDAAVVPIDRNVLAEAATPGLTAWQGHAFDPSLRRSLRFYPHRLDTIGFYIALIHRPG